VSTIIPRWEWRTFGAGMGAAESRLAALAPAVEPSPPLPRGVIQDSDEIYLLSTLCDANVKIRDGLLDIKELEETDRNGLEKWRPVLEAGFPLPLQTVARVFTALGLQAPAAARPRYTLEELIEELIAPEPNVLSMPVHKARRRYPVEGGAAELTRVALDARVVWTLAVESEDPSAVIAVLHRLGLQGTPNLSYPRALKGLTGLGPDPFDAD
jgi:exopolyphosphatase / guanosine-5'-triphosphate,3'-diphosphate pyrophosphatase